MNKDYNGKPIQVFTAKSEMQDVVANQLYKVNKKTIVCFDNDVDIIFDGVTYSSWPAHTALGLKGGYIELGQDATLMRMFRVDNTNYSILTQNGDTLTYNGDILVVAEESI